jgi:hypothetical protein
VGGLAHVVELNGFRRDALRQVTLNASLLAAQERSHSGRVVIFDCAGSGSEACALEGERKSGLRQVQSGVCGGQ